MSDPEGEDALYEHEPELIVSLRHHPELHEYLMDRGWGHAGTGMWRWIPSLAATPEDKWDVTTIMWDGTQVLVGVVGDWLTHAFIRESVEDLHRNISKLEAMRYEQ